jgi:uracil-DNA glycosylase family 4
MMATSFEQPTRQRIVPGVGPKDAKIVIVGEAPGSYENANLKPFVGPAGGVLEQCLHAASIIRSECYMTNVVKVQPKGNLIDPFFTATGKFTSLGMEWVERLYEELNELQPNIIVACGNVAFAATAGYSKVLKLRGYLFEPVEYLRNCVAKVLPTIHPSAALRGNYIYRHLIAADLKKAKQESLTHELIRPERQLVYEFNGVDEVLEWLKYFEEAPIVSFDIEVLNYELACIAFSSEPIISCSVPLTGHWSLEDEALIWRGIQRVLGNPRSVKVAQNAIFDIQFLLSRCGITVAGPIHDTMIAHSCMYPELQKGLGFLGSIYCGSQEYWKDIVKFSNIKEES